MNVLVAVVCLRKRENLQKEWGGVGKEAISVSGPSWFWLSLVRFQEDLGQGGHLGVGLGVS
jgi:hypothetical protein